MAVTYFQPKENMLYSLCFEDNGWWEMYGYNYDAFHGRPIGDPWEREFPDESLFQFFKVAENAYALANYKYGSLAKIETTSSYVDLRSGDLQKSTPIVTLFFGLKEGHNADWVQLSVSTVDTQGIVHAQPEIGGYLRIEGKTDFCFSIKEEKMNPATANLASINAGEGIDEPTFINGTAPQIYPVAPMLMNELYVPYFMVNDKTLPAMADRIQQTPYYILRQYGQFEMIAEYKNGSVGTVTYVTTQESGWSTTVSGNVSMELGIEIGGEVEENEIVVKEQEEAKVNDKFGVSLGGSVGGSGSSSEQIRAEAPPNTKIALYSTTANFELYQGDGVSAIAKPSTKMKMSHRYVSISDPTPES